MKLFATGVMAALAARAAKTMTLKGKLVSRDGINVIANAEIVQ